MYNRGGQRRTIEAGCGWRCVGHPQEVNKKYNLHRRYCKDCKESMGIDNLPDFDREAGDINGWKGDANRNQKPNQKLTTAFVNGVRQDILLDGVKTIEQAMDNTRLTAALIAKEQPILSKSQKKRQKQKDKKVKLCSNCNELPIVPNRKCFDDWCERCDDALYSTRPIDETIDEEYLESKVKK